jgi:hypothetical protein
MVFDVATKFGGVNTLIDKAEREDSAESLADAAQRILGKSTEPPSLPN